MWNTWSSLLWEEDWYRNNNIMRTQRISRKQMSDPTGTSSYQLSLSFPLFSQLCPSNASTPILREHLFQRSPAKFQKGSQQTCLSSVIHGPRKLLPSHSKWEELPKKRAKQPNKWNYKYPRTHKSRGHCPDAGWDSTKALIPITRSSNARQTTISSAIKHSILHDWDLTLRGTY